MNNDEFEFSVLNLQEMVKIIAKYPVGRQASAVLPLLDLAQRQNNGWVSQGVIEYIAKQLDLSSIRVYSVASFYTMFNLKPVGKNFIQVCTTTPCWLRGSDQIMAVCKKRLGIEPGQTSSDGKFSLAEVQCLGACVNAPMLQMNDDYYENLDEHSIEKLITDLERE